MAELNDTVVKGSIRVTGDVQASNLKEETWTFTLSDNTTVTVVVYVKP